MASQSGLSLSAALYLVAEVMPGTVNLDGACSPSYQSVRVVRWRGIVRRLIFTVEVLRRDVRFALAKDKQEPLRCVCHRGLRGSYERHFYRR